MQLEVLFANLPSNLKLTDNGLIVSFYTHSLKKQLFLQWACYPTYLKNRIFPWNRTKTVICRITFNRRRSLRWRWFNSWSCPTSSNAKRGRSENNTLLRLKPSSFAICAFLAVSLNIYHRRFDPPMNHVCFLAFGCKKKNQTVRREINWAELCFWNN